MPDVDDLVEWLRQQLDEDERAIEDMAKPVTEPLLISRRDVHEWIQQEPSRGVVRVRREVDAKRRLLYQFEHRGNAVRASIAPATGGVWDDLLRMLAAPYADRPGYREEWRP